MRPRAAESSVADGWRGARIGAETRERARRAATRIDAEIDLGDPPVPVVTLLFLLVSAAVTASEFLQSGLNPSSTALARAGGSGVSVVATGEWWKLLTANLLHAGVAHIAFNAVIIYVVARFLEQLIGRTLMVAVVLWSGVLCSVGAVWGQATTVAVGASGVAFGLLGCAVAIDPRGRTAAGTIARPLLIVSSIFTFAMPNISIGGHAGGLVGGALVGLVCWRRQPDGTHPAGRVRWVAAAPMLAAALAAVAVLAIGPRAVGAERMSAGPFASSLDSAVARQIDANFTIGDEHPDSVTCTPAAGPAWRCVIQGAGNAEQEVRATYRRDEPLPALFERGARRP